MALRLEDYLIAVAIFIFATIASFSIVDSYDENYNTSIADDYNFTDLNQSTSFYETMNAAKDSIIGEDTEDDNTENSLFKAGFKISRLVGVTFKIPGQVIQFLGETLRLPGWLLNLATATFWIMLVFSVVYIAMRFVPSRG